MGEFRQPQQPPPAAADQPAERHPDAALDQGETASQAQPAAAPSSGVVPGAEGGQTIGTEGAVVPEVAKTSKPELDPCPSCKIGLLYVITWDDEAKHEHGQAIFAPAQLSGGAAHRLCFHCGYGDTVALNPQAAPARPPWLEG